MLDYRPDLDPATAGLLTSVVDMIPTEKGYQGWHYPTVQTAHTLNLGVAESTITSLFATRWLSTPGGIVIAGTDKDLYVYEYTNGFIKVSKAGGYSLVGSTFQYGEDSTAAFDHCAFGDVLIAAHKSTVPQFRSSLDRTIATLYANLGTTVTAPQASVCAVCSNFVFLGDLNSTWGSTTSVVGKRDMVAWCGIGNHQNWDVNPISTQGSFAQFNDTPGPITALVPLGDALVVFKAASMYLGRYVGPDQTGQNRSPIWDFVRISDRVGCIGHRSVTDIGGKLVFIGPEDAYIFDGTRPQSITDGIFETEFRGKTNSGGIFPMLVGHDKRNNLVMIRRGNNAGYTLIWSYRYNKWATLYTGDSTGSPIGGGNDIFCKTNVADLRVITTTQTSGGTSSDHTDLFTMFAAATSSTTARCYNRFPVNAAFSVGASMVTGAVGQEGKSQTINRVTPRWSSYSASGSTLRFDRKDYLGAAWTSVGSVTEDAKARFDLSTLGATSTPWARFALNFPNQGGDEIVDILVSATPAGTK